MAFTTVKPPRKTTIETAPGNESYTPVITDARPDGTRFLPDFRSEAQGEKLRFHLVIFVTAFLIVCSRRPDAVLNPQFYAEEGTFFYRDAYQLGLHSLLLTYGGYYHTTLRLVALFVQLFPFACAPLVMNLAGIAFQVLPVNIFLSSRFSAIALPIRLLASFVYLGLPNSFEIHANITNVQWHLALLACLVLLAQPATTKGWQLFDGIALFLTSLSSPMGILLVPAAAVIWWKRRNKLNNRSVASLAILSAGAAIEMISVLSHWHGRQAPHSNLVGQVIFNGGPTGANLHYFAAILGRQVFLPSLLGLNTLGWPSQLTAASTPEAVSTVVGLALLLYVLFSAPLELKLFVVFAAAVLALDLVNPLAGPPDHPQWYWLCRPGCGNRYYFLPMLAFLASLLWVASRKDSPGTLRYFAVALLLLLPVGIYQDWRITAFQDFRFQEFAKKFERVPSGTQVIIPINPNWLMELTKH
jgi:hypothetical protein